MIYEYNGFKPVIKESSFIHPQANVTGNVIIGENCYIGPHCTIRGDFGQIIIEDGCNVQESCTVHMFPGTTVYLRKNAHIGHGAIVHGGEVGENCLIGMNAVLMDNTKIGKECIIGALAFVPAKMEIPDRSLVVGNPAKIIKEVTDDMMKWKTEGTKIYQELAAECHKSLKVCEPLREIDTDRPTQKSDYFTWDQTK
jgi:phenylacetic acid degradation protein/carnitine operon protein CaiE